MEAERIVSAPVPQPLAGGPGWRVSQVVCTLGPHDRPFEERHGQVSMAAVVAGTFTYHAEAGRALLYPGAVMLGNAGTCYECGHEHGHGDRCLAFQFEPDYFDEIAAGVTGRARFRFRAGMVPALPVLAAPLQRARHAVAHADPLAAEEGAIGFAEAVVATQADADATRFVPGAARRLSAALRHIEAHSREPLDLARLAAVAHMSKYHFVRTFRRVLGLTPYQFLLGQRLRRAAAALGASSAPVAAIAFDEGFGDLSEFHAQFRRAFGTTPGRFRQTA